MIKKLAKKFPNYDIKVTHLQPSTKMLVVDGEDIEKTEYTVITTLTVFDNKSITEKGNPYVDRTVQAYGTSDSFADAAEKALNNAIKLVIA